MLYTTMSYYTYILKIIIYIMYNSCDIIYNDDIIYIYVNNSFVSNV